MQHYPMIGQTDFGTEIKETLNARDLHVFLQSRQRFADWIKTKLNKVGFKEGIDFIIHKLMNNSKRGRKHIDYYITTEAAKQIALMENTPVGYEYRTYLIDRDKKLSNLQQEEIARVNYGHTAEIADHARIRLAMRLGGKAYAIKMWNKTSFGMDCPIEAIAHSEASAPNQFEHLEAYHVLNAILDKPAYVALTTVQLKILIKDGCIKSPKETDLVGVIRFAKIKVRNVRLFNKKAGKVKVGKVKVLVGGDVSSDALKAAVRQFDADYGL